MAKPKAGKPARVGGVTFEKLGPLEGEVGVFKHCLRIPHCYLDYEHRHSQYGTHQYWLSLIMTEPGFRHQGLAAHVLDAFFQRVARTGGTIYPGDLTWSGKRYLGKVIRRLAKKYKVDVNWKA